MHLKLFSKAQFKKDQKQLVTSEKVTNETENIELDKGILKEKYISLEQRQKIIDNPRLI